MPSKEKTASGLSFWSEEPSKYDYIEDPRNDSDRYFEELREKLFETPEVKIDGAGYGHGADMVKRVVPGIIANRKPRTLEFVSANMLKEPTGGYRGLHALVVRDKDNNVLLYAYGITLSSTSEEIREFVFEQFCIPLADRRRIEACAWSRLEYSVMIQLP